MCCVELALSRQKGPRHQQLVEIDERNPVEIDDSPSR